MRTWIRQRRISFVIVSLAILFLSGGYPWRGIGLAKDLPIPATVQELSAQPDQYDGHRVFVTGRVKVIKIEVGRRGSEFVAMSLEESSKDGAKGPSVKVFSLTSPPLFEGSRISVQGTYHREGRFGGVPYEEFIEADAILREK
ncbi:MAG TPA: hypothetical protein VIL61_02395 [Nitrospiria bacterium]